MMVLVCNNDGDICNNDGDVSNGDGDICKLTVWAELGVTFCSRARAQVARCAPHNPSCREAQRSTRGEQRLWPQLPDVDDVEREERGGKGTSGRGH